MDLYWPLDRPSSIFKPDPTWTSQNRIVPRSFPQVVYSNIELRLSLPKYIMKIFSLPFPPFLIGLYCYPASFAFPRWKMYFFSCCTLIILNYIVNYLPTYRTQPWCEMECRWLVMMSLAFYAFTSKEWECIVTHRLITIKMSTSLLVIEDYCFALTKILIELQFRLQCMFTHYPRHTALPLTKI